MKKILCLADLHIKFESDPQLAAAAAAAKDVKPDLTVIAGDLFESESGLNPYETLKILDCPVAFCLGNHEFAWRSVQDTLEFYRSRMPGSGIVHCLDVEGGVEFPDLGVNVVGNVLWYDGTMRNLEGQGDTIVPNWLDSTIHNFDWKAENKKCVEQIKAGWKPKRRNLLLTHTCPDIRLNWFQTFDKPSPYNMYSGCANLLEDLAKDGITFEWVVCGHTHRYMRSSIAGADCINIGNDYWRWNRQNFEYCLLEI